MFLTTVTIKGYGIERVYVAIPSNRVNVSYKEKGGGVEMEFKNYLMVAIPSNRVNVSYLLLQGRRRPL